MLHAHKAHTHTLTTTTSSTSTATTSTVTTQTTETTTTTVTATTATTRTTTTTTTLSKWSPAPHNDEYLLLFMPCDDDYKDDSCSSDQDPCVGKVIYPASGSSGAPQTGAVPISSDKKKFGTGSCDMRDGILILKDYGGAFNIAPDDDYTVEMWINWPNGPGDATCAGTCNYDQDDKVFDGGGKFRWGFKPQGTGFIMGGEGIGNGCGAMWSSTGTIKADTWYFFVWMRRGGTMRLGMDGEWFYKHIDAGACTLAPKSSPSRISIGGTPSGGERVPAYFDELRVTVCGGGKGCGKKARFDVTKDNRGRELFTVPTKPYCGGYKHECEG